MLTTKQSAVKRLEQLQDAYATYSSAGDNQAAMQTKQEYKALAAAYVSDRKVNKLVLA